MKRTSTYALFLLQALATAGCADRDPLAMFEEGSIELRPVSWTGDPTPLGKVAAVADSLEDVAVFGSLGASYYSSGTPVGSDASVITWRSAAVVPALDLPDSWLLGIEPMGQVYRLRTSGVLEAVSKQYGLEGKPVREVAALGSTRTAFALRDKVAAVDGTTVSYFDVQARGLAGAAGHLAAFDSEGVIHLDFTTQPTASILRLPLPEVIAVGFDVTGELSLVAATERSLYVEQGGALYKVWDAPAEATISGLATSGRGVWVAVGKSLSLYRGTKLLHGSSAPLPDGGRLAGSASGDVWVLGGAQLTRIGERTMGGSDEDRWRRTVLPMFQRLCRSCHLPNGRGNLDLSTYAQWTTRRALIKQRLVDQQPTPMPPPEVGALTQSELSAVLRWVQAGM